MEKERLVELVGKAQQGDKSALAELFYNYKDSVYFVAGKLLGSIEAAEEVVADTTEIVLRKLDTLDVPDGFFAWVRMIADSVIIKKLGGGFAKSLSEPVKPKTSVGDASAVSKEAFDIPEVRSLVASLVDSLPDDLKLCAYMFYHQRLAVENIAKVLGVDKSAATARLYAALNEIEAGAAERETDAGVLAAAPAWLIASALHEAGARFTLTKERSFELLNAAAKVAYAPKPEPVPTNEDVISREAGVAVAYEDEDGDEETELDGKAAVKDKKRRGRAVEDGEYDGDDEDEDDEDDYDDDEEYDEDDERPGFFSTLWGKLLIIFLALAIVGAAAIIFLPKILNREPAPTPEDAPAISEQQPEVEPEVQEPVQAAVTTADLAATYYGYYTDADNKSGKVEQTMTLNADGTCSTSGDEGTYVYDENSMKLTITTSAGTSTEWNCWLDGENIVLSQKAATTDEASMAYTYYQSEALRDSALETVDTVAG